MDNDHWIADLDSCGWFSDLSAEQAESLKAKLAVGGDSAHYLQLASVIIEDPDLIGVAGDLMSPEPTTSISSYEDLLRAYASASDGQFSPDAIIEEYNEEQDHFAIGFLAEGRIHALFIPGSPRFELEINDLVNETLARSGAEKRFFVLPTSDEKVALAFITPSVFECACQVGIIPLQEDLLTEIYGDDLSLDQLRAASLGSPEPAAA